MKSLLEKLGLKEKIILINLLLLSVSGLLVYFLVLPNINDIEKMKSEIEAQLIDLEQKYQRGQSLKRLSANLKLIEPEIDKLDSVFVEANKEVEFITSLENLAAKSNVAQRLTLGTAQKGNSFYKKIPLQITTNGTFADQLRYLENLEKLDYYVNIKSIELSGAAQTTGERSNLSMNLSVETYWR